MKNNKKILYVVNHVAFFVSHRLPIALAARELGYSIELLIGQAGSQLMEEEAIKKIEQVGISYKRVSFSSASINPFLECIGLLQLLIEVKKVRPSLVHCISPKGILYGGIVARIMGIKSVVISISGMGFAFTQKKNSNRFRFFISTIYSCFFKYVLKHPNLRIIVQNEDDRKAIISFGNLELSKVILVPGSGVELKKFIDSKIEEKSPIVLFPARMLWDKGVKEFLDAAKNLKPLMPEWRFVLAGAADYKNPTCVPKSYLEQLNRENIIDWVGYIENIQPYFAKASIVCLPSYREGLPKSLLEGAAAGCAIVTTDAIGCREAILPNITGFLVPIANSDALTNALKILMSNRELREQFGRGGRELAVNKFSLETVVGENIKIYEELFVEDNEYTKKN